GPGVRPAQGSEILHKPVGPQKGPCLGAVGQAENLEVINRDGIRNPVQSKPGDLATLVNASSETHASTKGSQIQDRAILPSHRMNFVEPGYRINDAGFRMAANHAGRIDRRGDTAAVRSSETA